MISVNVEDAFHFLPELHRDALELEVHAGLAGSHVPAGDLRAVIPIDHAGQSVEGGVGPHRLVATIPIDHSLHGRARIGQDRPFGYHMKRLSVLADGVDDLDRPAVPGDRPDVSRLSPAPNIEDGSIEKEAVVGHFQDMSLCGGEIGVLGRQLFSGSGSSHWWDFRKHLRGILKQRQPTARLERGGSLPTPGRGRRPRSGPGRGRNGSRTTR